MAQEHGRVGVPPARVAGREVAADVAGADRAQERVGDGVQRHVGVGMAGEPELVRDCARRTGSAAGRARRRGRRSPSPVRQRGAARRGASRRPRDRRAGSASCCSPRPRPSRDLEPGRGGDRGVVGVARRRPPRGAPPGSPRSGSPAASARGRARRAPPRRRRMPPSTRFRLSTTGRTGSTAAWRSSAASTRSISAAETSGRAASWISTRSGASRLRLSRPRRTVSCREPPPTHGRQQVEPGRRLPRRRPRPRRRSRRGRRRSAGAAANASTACRSDRLAGEARILLGQCCAEALARARRRRRVRPCASLPRSIRRPSRSER